MALKHCCNPTCIRQLYKWDAPYCSSECREWLAEHGYAEGHVIPLDRDTAQLTAWRAEPPPHAHREIVDGAIEYSWHTEPEVVTEQRPNWLLRAIRRLFG